MKRTKTLLSLFFVMVLLITLSVIPFSVSATNDHVTYTLGTENYSQLANMVHNDTNYAICTYQNGGSIYLKITDGSGTLLATITLKTGFAYCEPPSVARWDSDSVIVFMVSYANSATDYKLYVYTVGLTNYTSTEYISSAVSISSSTLTFRVGKIFVVEGSPRSAYSIAIGYSSTNQDEQFVCKFYSGGSHLYSKTSDTTTTLTNLITGFRDGGYIYYIYSYDGITPRFYVFEIASGTLTYLAISGYADFGTDNKIQFVNGTVQYVGGYVYLNFFWVKPILVSTIRIEYVFCQRLVFNGSIAFANLLTQVRTNVGFTTNYPASGSTSFCVPVAYNETNYRIYYVDDVAGTDKIMFSDIRLDNYTNIDYNYLTWHAETPQQEQLTISNPYSSVPFQYPDEVILHLTFDNFTQSEFQIGIKASSKYVYYNVYAFHIVYGWDITNIISTLNTLYTNATYTMEFRAWYNGQPSINTQYIIYINLQQKSSGFTNSQGGMIYPTAFYNGGVFSFKVALYQNNNEVYYETYNYTVFAGTYTNIVPNSYLLPTMIISLTLWLPALLLTFIPAILIGMLLSKADMALEGFIGGLCLGVGLGVSVGMLPFFMLILVGLILGIFLLAKMR